MPEENNEGQGALDEFKPITSQDELNKLIGERIHSVKSKYADYDDLKSKAAEFDKVQEANKTELQKAQERAAELEQRATQAERTALRTRIAAEMNVPVEVLTGDDEDTIKASAQKILEWRDSGKRPAPEPKKLKSGSSGESDGDGRSRAAAALRQLRGAH